MFQFRVISVQSELTARQAIKDGTRSHPLNYKKVRKNFPTFQICVYFLFEYKVLRNRPADLSAAREGILMLKYLNNTVVSSFVTFKLKSVLKISDSFVNWLKMRERNVSLLTACCNQRCMYTLRNHEKLLCVYNIINPLGDGFSVDPVAEDLCFICNVNVVVM